MLQRNWTLTLACADRVGIVAALTGALAAIDGFILDSQQFADVETGRFFMRVVFTRGGDGFVDDRDALTARLTPVAGEFELDWTLTSSDAPMRVLIAASQTSHCLNDLLHRWSIGSLPIVPVGVVSNHDCLRGLAEWHGLPFHHLPVTPETRRDQESAVEQLIRSSDGELLVLARYMQVLSPELTAVVSGRCINIHHSFLPSFKGARPYAQAHARGVKLIGATAHFVTSDLDEGPIIEQAVEPVDHRADEAAMISIGREIEARVLARAVAAIAERRVLLNGAKTVVFR